MPSKVLGFRDILKASWLKGHNEISLLSIDMDDAVWRVLEEVGFDRDYGCSYEAFQYRDMTGLVAVGFVAAGSMSINRKHLTSAYADLTDIMTAAAYQDVSLARELGELTGKTRSYNHEHSLDDDRDFVFPSECVEPTWDSIGKQIAELNALCEHIRGSRYSASGALKTSDEYKQYQVEQTNKGNN